MNRNQQLFLVPMTVLVLIVLLCANVPTASDHPAETGSRLSAAKLVAETSHAAVSVQPLVKGGFPSATEINVTFANAQRPIYIGIGGGFIYDGDDNEAPPLTVVSMKTNTAVASYDSLASLGTGFAYDPYRGYAYVNVYDWSLNGGNGAYCIAVFHGSSLVTCLVVGSEYLGTPLAWDGETDTVLMGGGSSVWSIAGTQILGSWPIGGTTEQGVYDPVNGEVYFVGGPGLIAIDGVRGVESGTVSVSGSIDRIAIDSQNGVIFATTYGNSFLAINPTSGTVTAVPGMSSGTDVTFDPVTGLIYVTNNSEDPIDVVNPVTDKKVGYAFWNATAEGPYSTPWGIVANSSTGMLYMADVGTPYIVEFQPGTAYFLNFSESGLVGPRLWSVNVHGYAQTAVAPGGLTFGEINGTYSYTVTAPPGYLASPAAGQVTINGAPTVVNISFVVTNYLAVDEQFTGDFIQNVSFANTIGIYADIGSVNASNLTASIGSTRYVPASPAGWGGPYNFSLAMGSLPAGSVLYVTAYFNNSTLPQKYVLTQSLPLNVAAEPSWLTSLISDAGSVSFVYNNSAEWNNPVTMKSTPSFPLSRYFGTSLSTIWLSGTTDAVPNATLMFQLAPNGVITLGATFMLQAPSIKVANLNVTVQADFSVVGQLVFNGTQGTISWIQSWLNLTVEANVSWSEPLLGWSVTVAGYTINIGLVLTLSFAASFTAAFLLQPTTSAGQEVFPGLLMKMTALSAQIVLAFTATLTFTVPYLVTLQGGGSLTFTMNLQASAPYDAGGTVVGALMFSATFIPTGTQWSATESVTDSWGSGGTGGNPIARTLADLVAPLSNSSTNFTGQGPFPRYYNGSGYNHLAWTAGNWSGRLVQDIYPLAKLTATSSGTKAYLAYNFDNVSRPETRSATLGALTFNSTSRTTVSLKVPVPPNEVVSNPYLYTLPNGSVLAIWSAIPFALENLSNPLNERKIIAQDATYSPSTGKWTAVKNWTTWGIARSYAVDVIGTQPKLAILIAPTVTSSRENLLEYDFGTGSLLHNWSVSNDTQITAFSASDNFAALAAGNLGPIGFNTSTGSLVPLPTETGYTLKAALPASGAAHLLSILYTAGGGDLAVLYNASTRAVTTSVPLNASVTAARFFANGGSLYLLAANGTQFLVDATPTLGATRTVQTMTVPDLYSVTGTLVNSGLLVEYLTNTGNRTRPFLNLSVDLVPLTTPPAPTLTASVLSSNSIKLAWTEPNTAPYGVRDFALLAGSSVSSLVPVAMFPATTTSVTYAVNTSGGIVFEVHADNVIGNGTPSLPAGTWSVNFTEAGLPSGQSFMVTLNGTKLGSTHGTVLFYEPIGSYPFTISSVTGYTAYPASGTVNVSRDPSYQAIQFVTTGTKTITVTFGESGLPSGTWWSVTLVGLEESSIGTSMAFYKAAGSYSYTVGPVPGYSASPASGSVILKKSAVKVSITFTRTGGAAQGAAFSTYVGPPFSFAWAPEAAAFLILLGLLFRYRKLHRRDRRVVSSDPPTMTDPAPSGRPRG